MMGSFFQRKITEGRKALHGGGDDSDDENNGQVNPGQKAMTQTKPENKKEEEGDGSIMG